MASEISTGIVLDSDFEVGPKSQCRISSMARVGFHGIDFQVMEWCRDFTIDHMLVGVNSVLPVKQDDPPIAGSHFYRASGNNAVDYGAIAQGVFVEILITNNGEMPARFVAQVSGPIIR